MIAFEFLKPGDQVIALVGGFKGKICIVQKVEIADGGVCRVTVTLPDGFLGIYKDQDLELVK